MFFFFFFFFFFFVCVLSLPHLLNYLSSLYLTCLITFPLLTLPAKFPGNIFVIHETLDIDGKICGIGGHLFFQLFHLGAQTNPGPRITGGINLSRGRWRVSIEHPYKL